MAVAFLLGSALATIAVTLGCGLNPLCTFYASLFHLCGSVLPLFYRDPRRAVLACFFINVYVVLLLGDFVEAIAKNIVRLSALYCVVMLWLIRHVDSPLKALSLYRAVSICGGPMPYTGVGALFSLASILLYGVVPHLGEACVPLSVLSAFCCSAGWLPWWTVRCLCLLEMLMATFGRDSSIQKRPAARVPSSFGGLWERMRMRGASPMHRPGQLPRVDVAGLEAHRDYLLLKKRDEPSLGRNQLCVLLAADRKVYCGVKTMEKWLRREKASPSGGPAT